MGELVNFSTKELLEKEPLVHPYAKPNRGQVAYYFNRSQKSEEFKFNDDSTELKI